MRAEREIAACKAGAENNRRAGTSGIRVAIVTVVRNDAARIRKTIDSVLSQSYGNYDYFIIDGASTDGTAGIIDQYHDRLSGYVSEKDNGLYDAMNKAIRMCPSDSCVYFLNSGDYFCHEHSLRDLCAVAGEGTKIILAPVLKIGREWRLLEVRMSEKLALPTNHQGIFCAHSELARHMFDTRYRIAADFDLYSKIFRRLKRHEIAVSAEPVSMISAGGLSDTMTATLVREYTMIFLRSRKLILLLVFLSRRSVGYLLRRFLPGILQR